LALLADLFCRISYLCSLFNSLTFITAIKPGGLNQDAIGAFLDLTNA
jgi:hypothetical protein